MALVVPLVVVPTPMSESQSVDVAAAAEAARLASGETALAVTAGHDGAAEVASAPTAEQLAKVAAEPRSREGSLG